MTVTSEARKIRVENTFCHYCGHRFAEPVVYGDEQCEHCGYTVSIRPPVRVGLIVPNYFATNNRIGIYITKVTNEDDEVFWELPTTIVTDQETWQNAASRAASYINVNCFVGAPGCTPMHIHTDNNSRGGATGIMIIGAVMRATSVEPFGSSSGEKVERHVLFPTDSQQLTWKAQRIALAKYWEQCGMFHNVEI